MSRRNVEQVTASRPLRNLLRSPNTALRGALHGFGLQAQPDLIARSVLRETPSHLHVLRVHSALETSAQLGESPKIKADGAQKAECTHQYMSILSTAQRRDWGVQPVVQRSPMCEGFSWQAEAATAVGGNATQFPLPPCPLSLICSLQLCSGLASEGVALAI